MIEIIFLAVGLFLLCASFYLLYYGFINFDENLGVIGALLLVSAFIVLALSGKVIDGLIKTGEMFTNCQKLCVELGYDGGQDVNSSYCKCVDILEYKSPKRAEP